MNYLAHIYLSGANIDLRFGNFIADSVPGKKYMDYSRTIQEWISLHRKIDSFTDQHSIFRAHKKLLFEDHGHYSAVLIDMFYDHFLASLWHQYHEQTLEQFSLDFYNQIELQQELLPSKLKLAFPYMRKKNWLLEYNSLEGLEDILGQMERRTKFKSNFKASISNLKTHYAIYENGFCFFLKKCKSLYLQKVKKYKQILPYEIKIKII